MFGNTFRKLLNIYRMWSLMCDDCWSLWVNRLFPQKSQTCSEECPFYTFYWTHQCCVQAALDLQIFKSQTKRMIKVIFLASGFVFILHFSFLCIWTHSSCIKLLTASAMLTEGWVAGKDLLASSFNIVWFSPLPCRRTENFLSVTLSVT